MPWHKAAAQMREFIEAMQAIFGCWYDGERLEYVGEYYQHTLMPATFTPDSVISRVARRLPICSGL